MKPPKIQTSEQAEGALAAYANAQNRIARLESEMNLKLTTIRERYADDLAVLAETAKTEAARLRDYADAHPELFDKSRSIKLLHGVIGYRLGNFAVKLIRGFKVERCIALAKTILGPSYIRTREDLDKDSILADREQLPPAKLASCGLRIEQAESFYITPEKTEAPE